MQGELFARLQAVDFLTSSASCVTSTVKSIKQNLNMLIYLMIVMCVGAGTEAYYSWELTVQYCAGEA